MTLKPLFPSNIVYVWALCGLALLAYSVAWFANMYWVFEMFAAIRQNASFDSTTNKAIDLVLTLLYYNPIFALFGWIVYGYVNSSRKKDEMDRY